VLCAAAVWFHSSPLCTSVDLMSACLQADKKADQADKDQLVMVPASIKLLPASPKPLTGQVRVVLMCSAS
jgi:hypothetical protein